MHDWDDGDPPPPRPWPAVAAGLLGGALITVLVVLLLDPAQPSRRRPLESARHAQEIVRMFRLPAGAEHELVLLSAGPDGIGEPRLAELLFPGEAPPRRLATVLLANVSASETWHVDFAGSPLLAQATGSSEWAPLGDLRERIAAASARLTPAERLRLRSLGAEQVQIALEPGSLRRILLALPPNRTLDDLQGVKWGTTPLLEDRADVESLRDFRADPAAGVVR